MYLTYKHKRALRWDAALPIMQHYPPNLFSHVDAATAALIRSWILGSRSWILSMYSSRSPCMVSVLHCGRAPSVELCADAEGGSRRPSSEGCPCRNPSSFFIENPAIPMQMPTSTHMFSGGRWHFMLGHSACTKMFVRASIRRSHVRRGHRWACHGRRVRIRAVR